MARRHGSWLYLLLVLAVSAPAGPARAETADQGSALCERAIVEGARREGIPEEILHAISLTETGRPDGGRLRPWPWAVNREGRGYWFRTRPEALAFARASLAEGRRSFDVGCFQINYKYHGHNFPSVEAMFEPDTGAIYAARFLRSLHQERGDWSAAAGAYHSQTPRFASIYRARFDRILAGLGGRPLVVAAAPADDARPRKSRTRIASKPLIITIEKAPKTPAPSDKEAAREASVRPAVAADAGFVPAAGRIEAGRINTFVTGSPR